MENDFKVYVNSLNIPKADYNGIMEYIDELPSAEPEQRWIPVTERLPEATVSVIVTSTNGYVYTSRIVSGEWEYGGNVTAWMPLPEPYKESSND